MKNVPLAISAGAGIGYLYFMHKKQHSIAAILGLGLIFSTLYYFYDKQTSSKSKNNNLLNFTAGYGMFDGSTSNATLNDQLSTLNCIELSTLYNNLKSGYVVNNSKTYLDAMSIVMSHMLKKGCAIVK